MTPAQLAAVGAALYGPGQWQAPLARDLDVSRRTLRRWMVEGWDIPPGVWGDCCALLKERNKIISELLDGAG